MRICNHLLLTLSLSAAALAADADVRPQSCGSSASPELMDQLKINHQVLRSAGHAWRRSHTIKEGDQLSAVGATASAQEPLLAPFPDPQQESYDVLHYALDLAIDPWDYGRQVVGSVEISLEPTGPKLYEVVLDLEHHMDATAVRRIGAGAQPFEQAGDQLHVYLTRPVRAGEVATLRVEYEGTPEPAGWGGFDTYWDRDTPVVWTLSEPEGAHHWWPCKDRPDDKATAEISVTMDDLFLVGSNGLLESVNDNGDGTATHNWAIGYPIPAYLVAITATDFIVIEDSYELLGGGTLPLVYYTWPESEAAARIDVQAVPPMMRIFELEWNDYPYALEKYGHAEFPWGGAMEHATLTSFGSDLYTGYHYYDWITAHELAHQWWGDLVTCGTWDDIWLNEGFATWGEAIWTEGLHGESAYLNYMQSIAESYFPGPIYAPDDTFNNTVYDKGAWILHMLRGIVGRETVMEILRQWGASFAHASAVTGEFKALAASVAGVNLDWFFDPWLYYAGRPYYDYSVDLVRLPGDSTRVDLRIIQTQGGVNPYRMPIQLRLDRAGEPDLFETVVNTQTDEFFELRVEGTVTALEPDPDGYILADFRLF